MFIRRLTRLVNPVGPPIPWGLADGNTYDLSLENGVLMINIGGTISPLIEIIQQNPNLLIEDYLANNIIGRDLIGMPYSLEQEARRLVELQDQGLPMREYSGNIVQIETEQGTNTRIINWEGLNSTTGDMESIQMKIKTNGSLYIDANQNPIPNNDKFILDLTDPDTAFDMLINLDLTQPPYNFTIDQRDRKNMYMDQLYKSLFDYYISLPSKRKQDLIKLPFSTVTNYQDKQYNGLAKVTIFTNKEIYRSQNGEFIIRDVNTQQEQLLTEFIAQKNRDDIPLELGPWVDTQIAEIKIAVGTEILKALHKQTKNP